MRGSTRRLSSFLCDPLLTGLVRGMRFVWMQIPPALYSSMKLLLVSLLLLLLAALSSVCAGISPALSPAMASRYTLLPLSPSSFRVFVPSTQGLGGALSLLDQTRVVEGMARMLAEMAGGCTAIPAQGFYVSDSGRLVRESVTILQSFLDLSSESVRTELESMSYFLASLLQQEAVLVQFDQQAFLLRPHRVNRLIQRWSAGAVA